MKRFLLLFLAIPLIASVNFTASLGMFAPSAEYFKSVYGNPIINFAAEGEFSFGIASLFAGVDFIKKGGQLTYTKEDVNLTMIPVSAGVRLHLVKFFFIDGGFGNWFYKEKASFSEESGTATGFFVGAGAKFNFIPGKYFRIRVKYSRAKKTENNFESDLSGLQGEVGVGFSF